MSPIPGTRIGPYEIVSRLGAGGMGEVYRARDARLERDVALKLLPEGFARDQERLARFEREARTVAGLSHPNIVTLHSIEDDHGVRFLTMELVEGEGLDRLVTRQGLPVERVLELALPLADALAAAHEKGIVHRDLKPSNIMVTREGRLKVLDFGLARPAATASNPDATQDLTVEVPLSGAGSVMGTVPYMAPEQVRGEAVDARTDLFAFGIVLYELLTGCRPFVGATSADVGSAILRDPPPPLQRVRSDLPRDLERIVQRCLEKSPRDRFQSAVDIHTELRLVQRGLAPSGSGSVPAISGDKPSVAVLPFVNMSADPENEFFSDGLTEELLNSLARNPGLRVTGRTSSFAFKGKQEDLREIGHKLGVSTLIEGSVRKFGSRVRITAQLIKVADGFHLWTQTYDRVLDDVFALQDEIAQAVSSALHVTLIGELPQASPHRNGESYELFLRAKHLVQQNSDESVAKAIELYRDILARDAQDARAWAGMGFAHVYRAGYGHGDYVENARLAREAAERAIALDDALADGHEVMAMVLASLEFRWQEGMNEVRRACELAPGACGPLSTLAIYEACFGNVENGLKLARQALEIDPLAPWAHVNLGRVLGGCGEFDAACDAFARAIEVSPRMTPTHTVLGVSHILAGRPEEGLRHINGEPMGGYRDYGHAIAFHALGRKEDSDAALARVIANGDMWAFQVAAIHAFRGEADAAFEWLERARLFHDSGMVFVRIVPQFNGLHGDPRWQSFLDRLGLGERTR